MTIDSSTQKTLRDICLQAGEAMLQIYEQDFAVYSKADSSPLTDADLAAHHIIADGIAALPGELGQIPILSEEGGIPGYEIRRNWMNWWLIDPLDGTKEFVKKNGEFTVNIALMERANPDAPGRPKAGWVYVPVSNVLYEGIVGIGARKVADSKETALPIETAADRPRFVASRSHRSQETDQVIDAVSSRYGNGGIVSSGSSLKLCKVAEGGAELYPRCAPTMEWDTAAADAVCRAAGARVVQASGPRPLGRDLEYGKEDLLNPWFIVGRDAGILSTAVESL